MWNQRIFGERLKFIMTCRREMSQKTLAKKLGVSPSTVSAWRLNPMNIPDLSKIEALAKVLKVAPCWLAFGCKACAPNKELAEYLKETGALMRDDS
jgi:transcriptional regulator with XRE-family HTH domain